MRARMRAAMAVIASRRTATSRASAAPSRSRISASESSAASTTASSNWRAWAMAFESGALAVEHARQARDVVEGELRAEAQAAVELLEQLAVTLREREVELDRRERDRRIERHVDVDRTTVEPLAHTRLEFGLEAREAFGQPQLDCRNLWLTARTSARSARPFSLRLAEPKPVIERIARLGLRTPGRLPGLIAGPWVPAAHSGHSGGIHDCASTSARHARTARRPARTDWRGPSG